LCRLCGFWLHELVTGESDLWVCRDCPATDFAEKVATMLGVPSEHVALFCLRYRENPRHVRFSFIPWSGKLLEHAYLSKRCPHVNPLMPVLCVLCVVPGRQDFGLLTNISYRGMPLQQLGQWDDNVHILLVMQYYCLAVKKIVSLGCWCAHQGQNLEECVKQGWLNERLRPQLSGGEVGSLPDGHDGSHWMCFEMDNDDLLLPRRLDVPIRDEHLVTGDVLIWVPSGLGYDGLDRDVMKVGKQRSLQPRFADGSKKRMRTLWSSRAFTDFTIKCPDRALQCHRAMLAAGSPVFESMLTSGMTESSTREVEEREGPKRAWKRLLSMARKQEDLFEAIADAL